jgi:hypothetical protein
MHTGYNVTYKGLSIHVYVDGAGLDTICHEENTAANQKIQHELFCKLVDIYKTVGLDKALYSIGAFVLNPSTPDIEP